MKVTCEVFENGLCLGCEALSPDLEEYLEENKKKCERYKEVEK